MIDENTVKGLEAGATCMSSERSELGKELHEAPAMRFRRVAASETVSKMVPVIETLEAAASSTRKRVQSQKQRRSFRIAVEAIEGEPIEHDRWMYYTTREAAYTDQRVTYRHVMSAMDALAAAGLIERIEGNSQKRDGPFGTSFNRRARAHSCRPNPTTSVARVWYRKASEWGTYLINARIDGRPLSDEHIIGSLRLLLNAGIDTTWSAIGSCLWHLAMHPDDRRRLAADPNLIPTAVEEFLRTYAPVTMAREILKETEINGCVFKPGQMVLLSFPAANRDPNKFPDADRVVIRSPPHTVQSGRLSSSS